MEKITSNAEQKKGKSITHEADMAPSPAKPKADDHDQVWDCGSSLYDSFELKSFERQLDSAIHSRSLSMPHLSDRHQIPLPPPPATTAPLTQYSSKSLKIKSSKLSRSFQKLMRSVFKSSNKQKLIREQSRDGFYVVYDKSGALTTIPEVPEFDGTALSPEIGSLVRRTASERFTAASIGISCA